MNQFQGKGQSVAEQGVELHGNSHHNHQLTIGKTSDNESREPITTFFQSDKPPQTVEEASEGVNTDPTDDAGRVPCSEDPLFSENK